MNEQEITKVLHDLLDNAPANEKPLATPYECGFYDGIEACILAISPDDPIKKTSARNWEMGKSGVIKEMAEKQGIPVVEHPPVDPDSIDPADFNGLPNTKKWEKWAFDTCTNPNLDRPATIKEVIAIVNHEIGHIIANKPTIKEFAKGRAGYEATPEQIRDFAINKGHVKGKILHCKTYDLVKAFLSIARNVTTNNIQNVVDFANHHLEVWEAIVLLSLCTEYNDHIRLTKPFVEFVVKHKKYLDI